MSRAKTEEAEKERRRKLSEALKRYRAEYPDKNPMKRPEVAAKHGDAIRGRKRPEIAARFRGEGNPGWKGGSRNYWQELSRKAWEEHHGMKIPKGMLIHHRDEDITNIDPSNLQLRTVRGHARWHRIIKKIKKRVEEIINP